MPKGRLCKSIAYVNGSTSRVSFWDGSVSFCYLRLRLFIDLNPKRAGKVRHPKANGYSSFRYYAYGAEDPLITPAPSYLELAASPKHRQACYQALIAEILKNDWKEKRPYSSVAFIGNPEWVMGRTEALKSIRRERFRLWKAIHRQRFARSNS